MNAKAENTSLDISIDPQTVYISTGKNQNSYAKSITVTIQNTTNSTVQIAGITVTLPDILAPYGSLGSITPVANPSELWDFNFSSINEGEFDATSVSGNAVPLDPNDEWQFSMQNVTLVSEIIQSPATVNAVVTFADGTTQSQPLSVAIMPAVSTVSFTASLSTINPGESTELSWNCTEIDYVIIDGLDSTHRNPTDSAEVQPYDTTTYTLYAFGSGVLLSAQQTITVGNAQIETFGAVGGISSVNYNSMVTFTWTCNQFTEDVSLTDDKGVTIPPLLTGNNKPQHGTITVGPVLAPTTFVFTAYGNTKENFDQAEPEIFINDVYYVLSASPDSNIWEQDSVTLHWNVSSAASVELQPPVENGPSLDNLVGSAVINPQQDITYTLSVSGFVNNDFGQFSAPPLVLAIQQVSITSFTQTPAQIVPDTGPNSCTLNWTTNAQVASLDHSIGNVNPNSSQPLTAPNDGTVYTLTAGTFQNPNLVTQPLTIINSYGPYTFTSFVWPDPNCTVGADLIITNPSSMDYLIQGVIQGGYAGVLTGVTITNPTAPTTLAATSNYLGINNSYFLLIVWPENGNDPLEIQWADPNNPSGTISLQVLTDAHLAAREKYTRLRRWKKKE